MGRTLAVLLLALCFCASIAHAAEVRYDWVIGKEWIKPDGFFRTALTVNESGSLTGGEIRVTHGDRLIVNVTNNCGEPFTVHFHGLHQVGSPWMDGVNGGTQCPIMPGQTYVYDFVVNQDPGTHIWHGHYLAEEGDGFHGAFIIEPNQDDLDALYGQVAELEERQLKIQDWYHPTARSLAGGLLNLPTDPVKGAGEQDPEKGYYPHWPGNPQNLLINGVGQWECPLDFNTKWGANTAWGFTYCDTFWYNETVGYRPPNATYTSFDASTEGNNRVVGSHAEIRVSAGQNYYFRLINVAIVQYMWLMIEDHDLIVVAADGQPVKPFRVKVLDANVAERYDFILEANGNPGQEYRIVVGTKFRAFGGPTGYGPVQNATLVYEASPSAVSPATGSLVSGTVTEVWGHSVDNKTTGFDPATPEDYFDPRWVRSIYNLPEDMTGPPDQEILVNGYMWFDPETKYLAWPVNNHTTRFDPSGVPALALLGTGTTGTDNGFWTSEGNNFFHTEGGKIYDFVIHNYGETWMPELGQIDEHPWHMHGYSFELLGYGHGKYPGFEAARDAGDLNLVDPPHRDMATAFPGVLKNGTAGLNLVGMPEITKEYPMVMDFAGPTFSADCFIDDPRPDCDLAAVEYGWTLVRLKAGNPGVWDFHCHLMWHLAMGMNAFIVTDPQDIPPMPASYASQLMQCQDSPFGTADAKSDMLHQVLLNGGYPDLADEALNGEKSTTLNAPPSSDARSQGAAMALALLAMLMAAALM
mmetsp:Transcript_37040/g.93558  ORF Transcript_37040/g.93558 Transcript_37040/m.93558 type:complete len:752 (-) Transcript_37040:164-2419(-)